MELTLLAPAASSAACSKALAFWAAAGRTAGPSMRADTTTNVTSTFLISLLPKSKTVLNTLPTSIGHAERSQAWRLGYHKSPPAASCQLGLTDKSSQGPVIH